LPGRAGAEAKLLFLYLPDVDFGEIAAQQLALALNPYPRADGATLEQLNEVADNKKVTVNERNSPFAVLGELKNKK